jgi:hypothetical protein
MPAWRGSELQWRLPRLVMACVDDDLRALAERVLGEPVVGLERLSDDQRRNYIARVRLASGGTAIVKRRIGADAERRAAFVADWAGPAFLTEIGIAGAPHAPCFLGGDAAAGLILLEDVAHVGTLVDALVGSDPTAAEAALLSFAERLARMHADTAPRLDAYPRTAAELDPSADGPGWFGRYARGPLLEDARTQLARIGVHADPEVWDELEELAGALAGPGLLRAYVHGDPCPTTSC